MSNNDSKVGERKHRFKRSGVKCKRQAQWMEGIWFEGFALAFLYRRDRDTATDLRSSFGNGGEQPRR